MSSAILETPVRGSKTPPQWRADLTLAIVALLWGTTFVVVKSALADMSTAYFLAVRFAIASACMAALFGRALLRAGGQATGRGLRGGAAAGVFLWAGYMLQTYGLKYTSAGKSGFLTGLYIVLVPVISAIIYKRWPQISEVLGIGVAATGMVFLTLPSLNMHLNPGDVLTAGCAVAFAIHLLVLGYFSQRENFEAVALGQIVTVAALSAISLAVEPPHAVWTPAVIFALVLTGVFATAAAFALQTWAQQYTSPTRTALIFTLEPVFALVTAAAVAAEPITAASLAGAGLILAGILLVELKPIGGR